MINDNIDDYINYIKFYETLGFDQDLITNQLLELPTDKLNNYRAKKLFAKSAILAQCEGCATCLIKIDDRCC